MDTTTRDQTAVGAEGATEPTRPAPNRFTPVGLIAVVIVGILCVAQADILSAGLDRLRLDPWMQAQQSFDYEHEFVRRGLVGEMLRLTGYPHRPLPMFWLSVAIFLALSSLTAVIAWQATRPLARLQRLVAVTAVLALPFALPHFAWDLGRYDALLYVLVIPLFLVRRVPLVAYLVAGVVGVLIHELFLVVHVPLLLVYLAGDRGWRATVGDRRAIALVAGGALAAAAVVLAGDLDSVPEPRFAAELEAEIPGYSGRVGPGTDPTHLMLYQDLGDQIDRTVDDVSANKLLNLVLAAIPGLLLVWACRKLRPNSPVLWRVALVVVPSACLYVTGIDWTRWVALASFNALLVILLDLRERPLDARLLREARVPLGLLLGTIALGSIGITNAYPLWVKVAGNL